jgi:hypothetical protein
MPRIPNALWITLETALRAFGAKPDGSTTFARYWRAVGAVEDYAAGAETNAERSLAELMRKKLEYELRKAAPHDRSTRMRAEWRRFWSHRRGGSSRDRRGGGRRSEAAPILSVTLRFGKRGSRTHHSAFTAISSAGPWRRRCTVNTGYRPERI